MPAATYPEFDRWEQGSTRPPCFRNRLEWSATTMWESAGGSFAVQKDTEMVCGEVKQGTKINFHLRDDQSEFLEERRLTDLVK